MDSRIRAAVVVGFTGKRDLRGKDEAVRGTLRRVPAAARGDAADEAAVWAR
jgi:hypothetical protein